VDVANMTKTVVHTIRGFRGRDRAIRGQRERPSPGEGVDGRIGHDTCLPASPGNGKGPLARDDPHCHLPRSLAASQAIASNWS
jgi:hypothetical protein